MGNFTKLRKAVASFTLSSLLVTSLVIPSAMADNHSDLPEYMMEAAEALLSKDALVSANKCEVAQLFVNALSLEIIDSAKEEGAKFQDLVSSEWCQGPAGALVENGIAEGMKAGEWFGLLDPETKDVRNVSRAEVVKMTVDALGLSSTGEMAELTEAQEAELESVEWARDHFAYAIEAGIVTGDAETGALRPTDSILKGDAAVVLYRATEGGESPSQGSSEPTPAPEVEAGALSVALSSSTPAAGDIPQTADNVMVATYDLTASNAVMVESLNITRDGLGESEDIDSVFIVDADGTRISNTRSFSSNTDKASVRLNPTLSIAAGETVSLTVAFNVDAASAGGVHYAVLASADDVVSNASSVSGSFPLKGTRQEVSSVSVGTLTMTAQGTDRTVDVGAEDEELGRFKLSDSSTNNDEDSLVRSITLENTGTLDTDNLSGLALYQSGTMVSEEATMSGDYITFVMADGGYLLEDGNDRTFEVRGQVIGGKDGETVILVVDEETDVVAQVPGENYSPAISASNVTLATINVNVGELAFVKDSSSRRAQSYGTDLDNFDVLTLRVSAAQAVNIKSLQVDVSVEDQGSAPAQAATKAELEAQLEDVKLFAHAVGQAASEGSELDSKSSTDFTATADGEAKLSFTDDMSIPAGVSLISVLIDTTTTSGNVEAGDKLQFSIDTANLTAEYDTDSNDDNIDSTDITGGDLAGAQLTGGAATVTVTRNDSSNDNDIIVAGAQDFQLVGINFDNNDIEAIRFDSLTFENTGNIANDTFIQNCRLEDSEGTLVSRNNESFITNGTVTFSDLSTVLDVNEDVTVYLICNFSQALEAGKGVQIALANGDVSFVTENDGDTVTVSGSATSADFDTSTGGNLTVNIGPNTADADIVTASSSQVVLGSYEFVAEDDSIEVTDLSLRLAGSELANRIGKLYLSTADATLASKTPRASSSYDFTQADFELSAGTLVIPAESRVTVYVKADLADITEIANSNKKIEVVLSERTRNLDGNQDAIVAVSGSTTLELSPEYIELNSDAGTVELQANNQALTDNSGGALTDVTYRFASRGSFEPGDSVVVTDSSEENAVSATIGSIVLTGGDYKITVKASSALPNDDQAYIKYGSLISASEVSFVDGQNAANNRTTVTVAEGHGLNVGDAIELQSTGEIDDAKGSVTVYSVTATTVTFVDANSDAFALYDVANDEPYIQFAKTSHIKLEEHILYNSDMSVELMASANDNLNQTGSQEIARFTVTAGNEQIEWSQLTANLVPTNTGIDNSSIVVYPVRDNGTIDTNNPVGSGYAAGTISVDELEVLTANGNAALSGGDTLTIGSHNFVAGDLVNITKGDGNDTDNNTECGAQANIEVLSVTDTTVELDTAADAGCGDSDKDTIDIELASAVSTLTVARPFALRTSSSERVSANSTETYVVFADSTATNAANPFSISVSLKNDSTYAAYASQSDQRDASYTVWSDMPNVNHTADTVDYANGYLTTMNSDISFSLESSNSN
jgi:hypothetical protein